MCILGRAQIFCALAHGKVALTLRKNDALSLRSRYFVYLLPEINFFQFGAIYYPLEKFFKKKNVLSEN